MFYSLRQTAKVFQTEDSNLLSTPELKQLISKKNLIAPYKNTEQTGSSVRGFQARDLKHLGPHIGFMEKPEESLVCSVFVTKGGVLKTSLTLNFARLAALHGLKTLILGLDLQGDISTAVGYQDDLEEGSFESALERIDSIQGLADVFFERAKIQDVIHKTDLPGLDLVPETPELVALEQGLIHKSQREQWLKKKVIEPLKDQYDLFLLDCSPNWNQLITNALTASDVLVSPLECKINNYRNFQMFQHFVEDFKDEMGLNLDHLYIPTRWTRSRKLSNEIKEWYFSKLEGCVPVAIRDSVVGEEAVAMHQSMAEYAPGSSAALEMNQAISLIWHRAIGNDQKHSKNIASKKIDENSQQQETL